MVVITVVACLLLATAIGFIVFQWQELDRADERVEDLLEENADLEAEGRATRAVLDLAVAQNVILKGEVRDRETSLELLLEEVERLS